MLVPVGPEGGCDLGQLARLLICCVSRMERGVGSEEPMYIVYSVHSYSSRPLRAIFNSSCSICIRRTGDRRPSPGLGAWLPAMHELLYSTRFNFDYTSLLPTNQYHTSIYAIIIHCQ
jgi:hypothetical protein